MDNLFLEKLKTQWKKIREQMSTFDAYFSKGLELYDKRKYQMAMEFFKIALSQSNAEPYANYNLALTYQKLNKPDDAIKYYEKFIEEYPQDQSAMYNVALIYYEREDYKHAANYFYKSFKLKQDQLNVEALTKSYLKMDRLPKVLDLVDYIFNYNVIIKNKKEKIEVISNYEMLKKVFVEEAGKGKKLWQITMEWQCMTA